MWEVLTNVASITGLIAFALVALGVLSSVVTRPRLALTASAISSTFANLSLRYVKGSSPARNLNMGFAAVDAEGVALSGDASEWRRDVMLPNDSIGVTIFDPAGMAFGGEAGENEKRLGLSSTLGAMVDFSWQHPIVPWLRVRQVVLWSQRDRAVGTAPVVLKGGSARRVYKKAMTPPG